MRILIISLPNSTQRRDFQQTQMNKLKLDFEFLDAISINDINTTIYKKHAKDWQRSLRNTEVACYYSHRRAWDKIIQTNQPALILEDDALLSKCVPKLLVSLFYKEGMDLVNFENRSRKKFIAKTGKSIACDSRIFRLYQDRTGAAGYILWPQGAKKLIQCEQQKGIALTDAHITACHNIKAYQIEPAPIIQLDQCKNYVIQNPANNIAAKSIISYTNKPKSNFVFRIKRIYFQLKLGLRQLILIIKHERRYIKIRKQDF